MANEDPPISETKQGTALTDENLTDDEVSGSSVFTTTLISSHAHRLVGLVGSVPRWSKLDGAHGGRRRLAAVRRPSSAIAHSGKGGYSILVT